MNHLNRLPLSILFNFLLAYVCYQVCRLAFLFENFASFSPSLTWSSFWTLMRGGLLFDTSAICYTNCLYLLLALLPFWQGNRVLRALTKWTFIIPNALAVIVNLMDTTYFSFTHKRVTADVFAEFQNEENLGSVIGVELIQHWYFVLLAIALIALLIFGYRHHSGTYLRVHRRRFMTTQALSLLLAAPLIVVGMRGALFRKATRPISPNDAFRYVNQPLETNFVLNTPFTLLRTIKHKSVVTPVYFTAPAQLDSLFNPVHFPREDRVERRKNVVILIVESFADEFVGSRNSDLDGGTYRGYTPFADSLIAHSLTFRESFCNGWTSIDAMPAVLAAIPRLHDAFVLSPFSLNRINSLATELGGHWGYRTAFFHGAENFSMGFHAFARAAGFQHYFGRDEYYADPRFGGKADFDGTWGIWDEPFLQFFCTKMSEMPEPFLTAVFTLSSHHPFAIPDKYKDRFPDEGLYPLHKCIRYTDHSLRLFFQSARQQPWFGNTLFVLCADHASSRVTHDRYKTTVGAFRVPILFFDPSGELPVGCVDAVAQQTDIMPTVLAYLGYDRPFVAYGKDLLHTLPEDTWAFTWEAMPQYIQGNYTLLFDGNRATALYDYRQDPLLQHNLIGKSQHEEAMTLHIQAVMQSLMQRMRDNDITIPATTPSATIEQ